MGNTSGHYHQHTTSVVRIKFGSDISEYASDAGTDDQDHFNEYPQVNLLGTVQPSTSPNTTSNHVQTTTFVEKDMTTIPSDMELISSQLQNNGQKQAYVQQPQIKPKQPEMKQKMTLDPCLFWGKSFLNKCRSIMKYWIIIGGKLPKNIGLDNLINLVIKYIAEREHFGFFSSNMVNITGIYYDQATFFKSNQLIKTVVGSFMTTKSMMGDGSKCIWNLRFTTNINDEYYFGIINHLDVEKISNLNYKWWTGDSFTGYGFGGKFKHNFFNVELCLDIKNGNLSFIDLDNDRNTQRYKISRHMKYRLAVSFLGISGDASVVQIIDFDVC